MLGGCALLREEAMETPETTCCPYCGHQVTVFVDTSAGDQRYVEDCSDCCCAMLLLIKVKDCEVQRIDTRRVGY